MAKVRILPQVLAHQIAAGEVIERPASVVKELVENALDAEATQIHVHVEEGGKRTIRVTDDGFGMGPEDAKLAFVHHATSKIADFNDLMEIRTLGFRGEALPSIASVARVTLRSVDREGTPGASPLGTEIRYAGGELEEAREITWPRGTEITVEDLFYNVPARRKFLKTVATELSHISRLVMCYALAFPTVEFRLTHQNKTLIDAPSVEDPLDRIFQLMGEALTENLVPMEYGVAGVVVSGFTSLPHEQRNGANALYLFVNRRMVRDRVLTHAIRLAYRDLIPTAAYPVIILFVDIDPSLIDVNVHPTKVEIRFRESQHVHSAIVHAIEQALVSNRQRLSDLARDIPLTRPSETRDSYRERIHSSLGNFMKRQHHSAFSFDREVLPTSSFAPTRPFDSTDETAARVPLPVPYLTGDKTHGDLIPETAHLSPTPVILGQFVESFIVAVDREGVMVIDQHVAHERILYDRALRSMASGDAVPSQRLLIPVTLELDPQQKAIAEAILEHLNENGFEVDWFGSSDLVIRAVPALAKEVDPARVLEEVLEEVSQLDELSSIQPQGRRSLARVQEKIAISVSCRAAIKINMSLTEQKMQWLIDELFRCDNPYTCPHGRPIILRLGLEEILRGFKRI